MKFMFASDIHGSAYYCRKLLEAMEKEQPKKLLLLGDILYHGPRNDLPKEYAPKEVIAMLNGVKDKLLAIRGNCDTEVDQMVLEFPIMADYALLCAGSASIYVTHGHIFHEDHLPPLSDGDVLLHGHTHLLRADTVRKEDGRTIAIWNPGSVSIPKRGNPHTYGILEDKTFRILTFEDELVKEMTLER